MKCFAKDKASILIHLKMDNTTYINKLGGTATQLGAEQPDQRSVDVAPEQEYQPAGNTTSRDKKHHSERGISCD